MHIKRLAMLSAATLALAACGHKTETVDNTTTVTTSNDAVMATPSNDSMSASNDTMMAGNDSAPAATGGQTFANTAAASDAFEIATSKLALTTSSSPAIKKFAQKMIDAHTASTAKLKSIAAKLDPAITPDPTLTAEQQQTLDALKTKTGAEFDQAYVTAQRDGHKKTLDALKAYSSSGDVPALKSFATDLIPTVAAHLNMANGLKP